MPVPAGDPKILTVSYFTAAHSNDLQNRFAVIGVGLRAPDQKLDDPSWVSIFLSPAEALDLTQSLIGYSAALLKNNVKTETELHALLDKWARKEMDKGPKEGEKQK